MPFAGLRNVVPQPAAIHISVAVSDKAKYFVIGYALIELYAGFANNPNDNVAHFAHLGGMIFGFILIMYWRKKIEEMGTIITDLKEAFRRGNIYIQLIYINVAVL